MKGYRLLVSRILVSRTPWANPRIRTLPLNPPTPTPARGLQRLPSGSFSTGKSDVPRCHAGPRSQRTCVQAPATLDSSPTVLEQTDAGWRSVQTTYGRNTGSRRQMILEAALTSQRFVAPPARHVLKLTLPSKNPEHHRGSQINPEHHRTEKDQG